MGLVHCCFEKRNNNHGEHAYARSFPSQPTVEQHWCIYDLPIERRSWQQILRSPCDVAVAQNRLDNLGENLPYDVTFGRNQQANTTQMLSPGVEVVQNQRDNNAQGSSFDVTVGKNQQANAARSTSFSYEAVTVGENQHDNTTKTLSGDLSVVQNRQQRVNTQRSLPGPTVERNQREINNKKLSIHDVAVAQKGSSLDITAGKYQQANTTMGFSHGVTAGKNQQANAARMPSYDAVKVRKNQHDNTTKTLSGDLSVVQNRQQRVNTLRSLPGPTVERNQREIINKLSTQDVAVAQKSLSRDMAVKKIRRENIVQANSRAGLSNYEKPRLNDRPKITLYHYTTRQNAMLIKSEKLVRGSNPRTTPIQYRRYGDGVYFTSLSPEVAPDKLALNNFTNRGTQIYGTGLYRKIQYVVRITFDQHEVEKIHIPRRDVYLYRGSIDLSQYEGRYKIYENLKCPVR